MTLEELEKNKKVFDDMRDAGFTYQQTMAITNFMRLFVDGYTRSLKDDGIL